MGVATTTVVTVGRLLQDLKQRRPFASAEEEAYLNLVRTADFLAREVAAVLKPYHLSEAQYNVLRILRGAGDAGHTCSEIAARLVTRDPDVTRLLDKLETRGWLTRGRGHADRRVVTTHLTPDGRAVLQALDRPVREGVARLLAHVPATKVRALTALLELARASAPATGPALQRPRGGLQVGQRAARLGGGSKTA